MGSRQVGLLLTVVMLVLVFDCGNCNTQRFEAAKSIRVEDSTSILHRNSRSNHRYQRSVPAEMKELLGAHNRLRRLEGASNMELMVRNCSCHGKQRWCEVYNNSEGQQKPKTIEGKTRDGGEITIGSECHNGEKVLQLRPTPVLLDFVAFEIVAFVSVGAVVWI